MRRWMFAGVALVAVSLSGCVASPSPFDGRRVDADRLPGDVATYVQTGDVATSRFQGTSGVWDLYLVHGTGPYGFCLVYTDGTAERSGTTCAGGTWVRASLPDGAEFEANISGFVNPPTDDQVQISTWVRQLAPGRQSTTSATE
ncbi:hypothetical protein [Leifsonia sp. RAF41]|uniref:hypothetical protein n=1 Tax=Leifsonia sp. RAF41 TaxID=3233056 RepID=UPI003F9DAFAA